MGQSASVLALACGSNGDLTIPGTVDIGSCRMQVYKSLSLFRNPSAELMLFAYTHQTLDNPLKTLIFTKL